MLNRISRLNISLAAKCQLLFGAAVVMIISAALAVPWQRMGQLTDQLDQTAAEAVADGVLRNHVMVGGAATTAPATAAPRPVRVDKVDGLPPRLLGLSADHAQLTRWERQFLAGLRPGNPPASAYQTVRRNGAVQVQYAQSVFEGDDCVRCHAAPRPPLGTYARWTTDPSYRMWQSTPPKASGRLLGFVSVDMPSRVRTSQLLLNNVFLLTAGTLAGTLAIATFYLITTRLILQPVRVLQETAAKVAGGDLNIRSDIVTGDEFQQLSETFNTMLANLGENADRLRQANKALDLKVDQLAQSNVALFESNRLKSEFLANVSHELRTPLNSILGFAELLQDTVAHDPKTSRYVGNILGAGKSLLELINDLLDLAKIEAGRMEVRAEPLSLSDLFEGLTSVLKPATAARGLEVRAAVDPAVPILRTDPAKLQQVLYNFLSNAIKFSPAGGDIALTARPAATTTADGSTNGGTDGRVRIEVTDHGPGIAAEQHAMIFEKFRQIDGSVTRQHSGTGLGLAICRELTQLLAGDIGVDSAPGRGATFWVELPVRIEPSVQDVRGRMMLT